MFKSTAECLTDGTERSSPKMPFTLLLVFLVKKKILFFLSSDLAAEPLSCTGCLPGACRLCAPADKDCAAGNHCNDVPNSLHRVIAEKTQILACFQVLYICSRIRIVFVCVCIFNIYLVQGKFILFCNTVMVSCLDKLCFVLPVFCESDESRTKISILHLCWMTYHLATGFVEKQVACDQSAE